MRADEVFDDIAAQLAGHGVRAGAMFGARALKADGKAFACLVGEVLVLRLGDGSPAHVEAHGLSGAELFDPSGAGHPWKDWVAVPAAHADRWGAFAATALTSTRP